MLDIIIGIILLPVALIGAVATGAIIVGLALAAKNRKEQRRINSKNLTN